MKYKIIEITKENKDRYLKQIVELEIKVLKSMEEQEKTGQLFITGKEDIEKYIDSEKNTVEVAINQKDSVISVAYITQEQEPFTYNDITKYFKYGDQYKKHVKTEYSKTEYRKKLIRMYDYKVLAYKHAKQKIQEQYPEYESNIEVFLEKEIENNGFHEKSELREKINKYMYEYISSLSKKREDISILKEYEQFFWANTEDVNKEFGMNIDKSAVKNKYVQSWEKYLENQREYEKILNKGQIQINEEPTFNMKPYFEASTKNSIEIDTYLTDPNSRHSGIARAVVFEGIKKHITQNFSEPENEKIYLCSTLHRENLSSKYVSEFFGLDDSLYVKRRQERDREVHICRLQKENSNKYIDGIYNKLAVLYGYNPENIEISKDTELQILKEQYKYEQSELLRLNNIDTQKGKEYKGKIADIPRKIEKVSKIKDRINLIENEIRINKKEDRDNGEDR